jgi:hypothetical protein
LKARRERERERERERTHTHTNTDKDRERERDTHTHRVTTKVERIQSLDVLMEQEHEMVPNSETQLAKCVVLEKNLMLQLLVEWELERGEAEL